MFLPHYRLVQYLSMEAVQGRRWRLQSFLKKKKVNVKWILVHTRFFVRRSNLCTGLWWKSEIWSDMELNHGQREGKICCLVYSGLCYHKQNQFTYSYSFQTSGCFQRKTLCSSELIFLHCDLRSNRSLLKSSFKNLQSARTASEVFFSTDFLCMYAR